MFTGFPACMSLSTFLSSLTFPPHRTSLTHPCSILPHPPPLSTNKVRQMSTAFPAPMSFSTLFLIFLLYFQAVFFQPPPWPLPFSPSTILHPNSTSCRSLHTLIPPSFSSFSFFPFSSLPTFLPAYPPPRLPVFPRTITHGAAQARRNIKSAA